MTNADKIRSMNNEELCDYIYSVFLTGKYYGKMDKSSEEAPNYLTWLNSDEINFDITNYEKFN